MRMESPTEMFSQGKLRQPHLQCRRVLGIFIYSLTPCFAYLRLAQLVKNTGICPSRPRHLEQFPDRPHPAARQKSDKPLKKLGSHIGIAEGIMGLAHFNPIFFCQGKQI